MRSICFNPKTPRSSPSNSPSRFSISTPRRTESLMEQTIDSATALILKWNPDSSTFARVTSLFYENRREATQFLKCVYDLQKIMHLLVSHDSADDRLIHSQNLMQIAMKRLQKEFYQILSMNRAHLDPESVSTRSSRASTRSSTSDFEDDGSPDDEARLAITEVEEASTVAMSDLKSIAECMIYSGYTKECLSIYKSIRKSIIDEGIYRLGVEKLSSSQVNKMDWRTIEIKIRSWLEALRVSIRTLFNGERILCDHVFASSDSIREACFTEISKDGAMLLFGFPELVAKTKKLPEKMFRILDMYTAISENWPEIDSTFSFESTSGVKAKALDSLVKLIDCVRILLSDFETSVQKDSSKTPVPEGGLHSLTFNTMDYLTLLADYSNVLSDIIADLPPLEKTPLPESYFNSPDSADSSAPAISVRFAWLILVLLCKLDGKSKHYKDVSLSYLFLANNLQHVVSKVRTSNLKYILGEDWITKHVVKVKQFVSNYERLAWGQVLTSLPDDPSATLTPQQVKEKFRKFTSNFEEAYKKQSSCVISNPELRDEMKNSISRKLLTKYRQFYDIHKIAVGSRNNERMIVRYAPEDVEAYLSDLYFDTIRSDGSFCSWSSSSSSHKRRSRLSG